MISLVDSYLEITLVSRRIATGILELGPLDPLTGRWRSTLHCSELKTVITIWHQGTHHVPNIGYKTATREKKYTRKYNQIDAIHIHIKLENKLSLIS